MPRKIRGLAKTKPRKYKKGMNINVDIILGLKIKVLRYKYLIL